jgi:hypothetical protein
VGKPASRRRSCLLDAAAAAATAAPQRHLCLISVRLPHTFQQPAWCSAVPSPPSLKTTHQAAPSLPQNHPPGRHLKTFPFRTPQVVKAASGKFHPLHQWLYFDSIESLPDESLPAEEVASQVRLASCAASRLFRLDSTAAGPCYAPSVPAAFLPILTAHEAGRLQTDANRRA